MKKELKEKLEWLLDAAYQKGQAYYDYDCYGRNGDSKQDWDMCEEKPYKRVLKEFIKEVALCEKS